MKGPCKLQIRSIGWEQAPLPRTGGAPERAEARFARAAAGCQGFDSACRSGTGHIELIAMIRSIQATIVFLMVSTLALAQQVTAPVIAGGRGGAPGRGAFAPVVIGPSAPVPPEVALPRPTAAELSQVNVALKHWVDSDKSPNKVVLQKFV